MPTFRLALLLLCLLIVNQPTPAAENVIPPLLVVTDLRILGENASTAEAQAFSEFIRKSIESTGKYRMLSRTSMLSILKAKGFTTQCFELPCFAEMGRILGADQVLAGHLQRRGISTDVTLRLIDAKNNRFINTIHKGAQDLSLNDLIGGWGLDLISELFSIDRSLFQTEGNAVEVPTSDEARQQAIPDEVRNRFPGMVYIPAGETIVGSNTGDKSEMPPHTTLVQAFYISRFEITNKEYQEFVSAGGHAAPPHWKGGVIPAGMENHPVTWVSYSDAEAYCNWREGRLPTEYEWERAAHGSTPRVFPWGDSFDPNRANTWEAGRKSTAPVGSFPFGASPFGVEDMAGNVFEWVGGFFQPYPGSKVKLKEYDQHLRVLRGGSWNFNEYYARTTHRFARSGGEISRSFGFRMVREAK